MRRRDNLRSDLTGFWNRPDPDTSRTVRAEARAARRDAMGDGTVSTVRARHLEADLSEDGFPCKVIDPTVLTQMYPRTPLVIAESRTVGDLHRVCMVKEGERASGKPLDEVREVLVNFLAKQQDGKHSFGPATQF